VIATRAEGSHAARGTVATFEERWPGFTGRLITRRVPFERYEEALAERDVDIKVLIAVGSEP
jgi:hypothetical protein